MTPAAELWASVVFTATATAPDCTYNARLVTLEPR